MNFFEMWNSFSVWTMQAGMPLVALYHMTCSSPFLNVAAEDATGIEKFGNVCLTPVHYLFAGSEAHKIVLDSGDVIGYGLKQKFVYEEPSMWFKSAISYTVLPPALIVGGICKAISYLSEETRHRHQLIVQSLKYLPLEKNDDLYRRVGIEVTPFEMAEKIESLGYERRPEDLLKLKKEKKALSEIVKLFHENGIMYWLDCGTCLGAYRYGGSIPWDWDVDIAILQNDFDNVRKILSNLDPEIYHVQDWSSREFPKTYLKVYVKGSDTLIDIYHFGIDEHRKTVHSIFAHDRSIFMSDSWKINERRYTIPTPFEWVFPLKKISFDGIEAYVPNKIEQYLEQRYGKNISPAKVYDSKTGKYEKVADHPYWKIEHVNTR